MRKSRMELHTRRWICVRFRTGLCVLNCNVLRELQRSTGLGGFEKTYVVSPDLNRMQQLNISLEQLQQALAQNNENRGAGYIEDNGQQLTVRVPGTFNGLSDIENTMLGSPNGSPIRVGDIAQVSIGHDLRTGGATYNGKETVLGIAMMAMGGIAGLFLKLWMPSFKIFRIVCLKG